MSRLEEVLSKIENIKEELNNPAMTKDISENSVYDILRQDLNTLEAERDMLLDSDSVSVADSLGLITFGTYLVTVNELLKLGDKVEDYIVEYILTIENTTETTKWHNNDYKIPHAICGKNTVIAKEILGKTPGYFLIKSKDYHSKIEVSICNLDLYKVRSED